MKWEHNDGSGSGGCFLQVYDPDDWSLVGESNLPGEIQSGYTIEYMKFGSNDHGDDYNVYSYFDNMIIDYTDATYPLLPEGGSSGCTQNSECDDGLYCNGAEVR